MAKKKSKKDEALKALAIDETNGWNAISATDKKKLQAYCSDYIEFLSAAKTERECHDIGVAMAEAKGYTNIEAVKPGKKLKVGDKVYYSAAGKTLLLIHVGKRPLEEGLRIVGGHTDSPRIDLKQRPIYEADGMAMFDTHYYGGIKKYQWVTIPLALYGVVAKKDGATIKVRIGDDPNDPVFTITDLLPHLGKDQMGKNMAEGITGEGLNVLAGSMPADTEESDAIKLNVLKLLNDKYGMDEADFMSAEFELVPAGPARELGIDRSMILGYGHDDRICAYAGMRALLDQTATPEYTGVCVMCDKEEIGSVGTTGMQGHIFENTIAELLDRCEDQYCELTLRRCLKNSKMISADVNALHDPNYSDVSSPNKNMARLNMGAVLTKYTGSRGKSGSNDASAEYVAEMRQIFDKAKVLWQTGELGKVDQGGGGTIAYMLARYEMDVIDCGVGVFSMHAPHEVAGKLDVYMTYKGYTAFYKAK